MSSQFQCAIWGTPARGSTSDISRLRVTIDDSDRAGGSYTIELVIAEREIPLLDDATKARLTTYLIRSRQLGNRIPHIGRREVEDARSGAAAPVHERALSLLTYIAEKTDRVGQYVVLDDVIDGALAWSGSTDAAEVVFLTEYLGNHTLLLPYGNWHISDQCAVSVDGYSRLEADSTARQPRQAFVAMWFDESMAHLYDEGIRPAIEDVGYTACRIDRTPSIGKIDDEIIREIRRSRFMVADFTQGPDGSRGSVYYEAGFARGLELPVISTCRKDQIAKLAFDTRQFAHIPWTDPQDLRRKLADRIGATIGEAATPV